MTLVFLTLVTCVTADETMLLVLALSEIKGLHALYTVLLFLQRNPQFLTLQYAISVMYVTSFQVKILHIIIFVHTLK